MQRPGISAKSAHFWTSFVAPQGDGQSQDPPILWVDGVKLERRYNFPEFGDRRASKVGRVIHFQRTKHRLLCEVLLQATSAHGRGDSEPAEEICGPFGKFVKSRWRAPQQHVGGLWRYVTGGVRRPRTPNRPRWWSTIRRRRKTPNGSSHCLPDGVSPEAGAMREVAGACRFRSADGDLARPGRFGLWQRER